MSTPAAAEAVKSIPPQHQEQQPGMEAEMTPKPEFIRDSYKGSGKLSGKVVLITGGDSGIGRSVAVHFAREGADVAVMYLDEHKDAKVTEGLVQGEGRKALLIPGDIKDPQFCKDSVQRVVSELGRLDVLVNNAAIQHFQGSIESITPEQIQDTFATNIMSMFYLSQAAMDHLPSGGSIINTTSVTAYMGHANLLDYASTKGAIVSFTRSLAQQVVDKGIRVNAVAPGPVWTPLIPATFPKDMIETWKNSVPMKRAAQPSEIGPAYVFLASEDGSYFSGQVLHPNGGTIVNA